MLSNGKTMLCVLITSRLLHVNDTWASASWAGRMLCVNVKMNTALLRSLWRRHQRSGDWEGDFSPRRERAVGPLCRRKHETPRRLLFLSMWLQLSEVNRERTRNYWVETFSLRVFSTRVTGEWHRGTATGMEFISFANICFPRSFVYSVQNRVRHTYALCIW